MRRSCWIGVVLAGLALAACAADDAGGRDDREPEQRRPQQTDDRAAGDDERDDEQSPAPTSPVAEIADPGPVTCPPATVTVGTAAELQEVLDAAAPGDVIGIEAGTYEGKFVATTKATPEQPIFLCGERDAVLDGGGVKKGYGLHLDHAAGWRLVGFTVSNAQKGVVVDGGVDHVIQGLLVEHIGDEAIHLRAFSTDNIVRGNEIHDTGLRRDKFGEGVYVGSAVSNWEQHSGGEPDRSDRNLVVGNTIWDTTSEAVDIKEGTTGGVLRANSFDGSDTTAADSWVDVKGNGWLIEGNTGVSSPLDGFQLHEIERGWGTGNTFRGNDATVDADGYGVNTTNTDGNIVACDNTVTGASEGLSDVACTP
jgi:hypothetical protein